MQAVGSVDFVAAKFLDGLSPLALLVELAHGKLLGLGLASPSDASVGAVVTTNASADVTMTIDRTRINKTSEGRSSYR